MKTYLIAFLLLAGAVRGIAQNNDTPPPPPPPSVTVQTQTVARDSSPVFTYAEQMPEFPGGQNAFFEYLKNEIHYPPLAKEKNHQGTVYVQFIVEKDGSISNVKLMKGVKDAPELSEEAVRVIEAMPKWTPGRMRGIPVRVTITQPVKFVLTKDSPQSPQKNIAPQEQASRPASAADSLPPMVKSGLVTDIGDTQIYSYAEHLAEFPGGSPAFEEYMRTNIQYPKEARDKGRQGTVYVQFVVEKDGRISNAIAVRGVPDAPELSTEAVRVIMNMPKWKPATMKGKVIRVSVTQPVNFSLPN